MFFQLTLLACLLVGSLSADSGLKTAASSSNTRAYFVSNYPRTHTRTQVARTQAVHPSYDASAASATHFQPAAYRPRPVAHHASHSAPHHTSHHTSQPRVLTRELPTTNFKCSDKPYIPGIYADTETNCEVYHYCTPSWTYSFACGEGTVFNQKILSCDYPNSSSFNHSCAETPNFYSTTAGIGVETGVVTPEVQKTSFTCQGKPFVPGYYADEQAGCSVYHVCVDDQQVSFNCAEGTIFSQELLTCTYASEVNCQASSSFWNSNAGIGQPASQ